MALWFVTVKELKNAEESGKIQTCFEAVLDTVLHPLTVLLAMGDITDKRCHAKAANIRCYASQTGRGNTGHQRFERPVK